MIPKRAPGSLMKNTGKESVCCTFLHRPQISEGTGKKDEGMRLDLTKI